MRRYNACKLPALLSRIGKKQSMLPTALSTLIKGESFLTTSRKPIVMRPRSEFSRSKPEVSTQLPYFVRWSGFTSIFNNTISRASSFASEWFLRRLLPDSTDHLAHQRGVAQARARRWQLRRRDHRAHALSSRNAPGPILRIHQIPGRRVHVQRD